MVGDTSGAGKAALKTVQNGSYLKSILTALNSTTWADWDVLQLGWRG
jgi:hypothetical protein